MEQEQKFQCTGDCLTCRALNERKIQWQYCAAQNIYNSMRMIQDMQENMKAMTGTIEELKAKISAIQDSEAMVFEPSTTQEGDGVTEKMPQDSQTI